MHPIQLNRSPVVLSFISVLWIFTSNILAQPNLPSGYSTLFSGSGECVMCHASNGTIMMEGNEDISPVTQWRSSMMAHASKDPLWQAKVAAEVDANPALQSVIEDKCTTCHAPLGRTEEMYTTGEPYTFNEAMNNALALDGVSCTLCHQIQTGQPGR